MQGSTFMRPLGFTNCGRSRRNSMCSATTLSHSDYADIWRLGVVADPFSVVSSTVELFRAQKFAHKIMYQDQILGDKIVTTKFENGTMCMRIQFKLPHGTSQKILQGSSN